jgi:ankyrin repeat protein
LSEMRCPPELRTEAYQPWSRGRGVDVWAMLMAAAEGDLVEVKALAERDPGLLNCEFQYFTPLHFALRENRLAVVEYLLPVTIDPLYGYGDLPLKMVRDRGYTELGEFLEAWFAEHYQIVPGGEEMAAAIKDFDETRVRGLMDSRPELVSAADGRGNQPIHWAALTRQLWLIDLLMDRGADMEAKRPDGARPINLTNGDYTYRAWYRDLPAQGLRSGEVVTGYFLARGVYCDLAVASKIGYYRRVAELLDADVGIINRLPDYVGFYNGLPLRNAAGAGHMEVVKLLLDRGANVNEPEPRIAPFGGALHAAVSGRHYAIVKLLLDRGADANAMVESSGDVLHMAKVVGAPAEIIELIAARAAHRDPDIVAYEADAATLSALLEADPRAEVEHWLGRLISEHMQSLLELILRYQPDILRRQTMLSAAWWDGSTFASPEQARWLLERGLDPRLRNWLGITMLHRCAAKGLTEIAAVLLEFGADINAVETEWAQTPRGWAVHKGQIEMAEWLAARGG